MLFYCCDQCKSELPRSPPIVVTGYVPPWQGSILLPNHALERHFCSAACLHNYLEPPEETDV